MTIPTLAPGHVIELPVPLGTRLSDLRRNGLMTDEGGHCRANDILFPEKNRG